ncbi:MAG: oxygenase MpaB family protein [Marmoricola sp.]
MAGPRLIPAAASHAVQRRLGLALRSRVAGADAPARAARIWGAEGERWFTAEDPIWRVNADAAMFPGGLAALLLQSLHPSAMAGVAGHSGYKGDPWGRLQRTSHYLAVTTFGTIADAEKAIEHVRSVHRRVRGTDELGRPYAADDPHLLRWVHVSEIWSFLNAYQSYAAEPLNAAEADLFVEQTNRAATLLGATELPTTVRELDDVIAGYRPELESTAAAREATRFILLNPPVPISVRPGYALIAAGGIALLPTWARRSLRLPVYGPGIALASRAGALSTALVRWGMAGLADRAPGDRGAVDEETA